MVAVLCFVNRWNDPLKIMVSKLANEIFQFLEVSWHFVVAKIRYLKCTLITKKQNPVGFCFFVGTGQFEDLNAARRSKMQTNLAGTVTNSDIQSGYLMQKRQKPLGFCLFVCFASIIPVVRGRPLLNNDENIDNESSIGYTVI